MSPVLVMVTPPPYGTTCRPCRASSRSRNSSGRSRLHTYEQLEYIQPFSSSRLTAAPPIHGLRSRTRTLSPERARYAALVRPLWPEPMTMASYLLVFVTCAARSTRAVRMFWAPCLVDD